jgi:hypothetical protein
MKESSRTRRAEARGGVKESKMPIPFIPKEYTCNECNGFRLWHADNELKSHIELIIDAASYALDYASDSLKFKSLRKIEICVYHSNDQAVSSLSRRIPGNMAMAPFSNDKGSLIIVQNPLADPMNGDLIRMRRILAHEICHLFVREKSGSSSCLGDGLKNMKVRPWIDEGLAEYLSWNCVEKSNPIFQEQFEYIEDLNEVDLLLNDFGSDRRMSAFFTSASLVGLLIGELGLLNFFDSMIKLSEAKELPKISIQRIAKGTRPLIF